MSPTTATSNVDPAPVWQIINGLGAYWVVATSCELRLFDALVEESRPLDALAGALGCDAARLSPVCDALVALGLLERSHGLVSLTATSRAFLLGDAPRSMRDLVLESPGPPGNWPALATTLRGSEPPQPVDASFYARLAAATFPTQYAVAQRCAPLLRPYARVLDLGAGAAPWAVALLEEEPSARAIVNDLDGVTSIARCTAEEHGVADRVDIVAGDYLRVDVPDAAFDVVVLGNILRAEPVERVGALCGRAVRAAAPGGRIVVTEYFLDEDRAGPLNAVVLGATMLAATGHGHMLTVADCAGLLASAGCDGVDVHDVLPRQRVVIGRVPGRTGRTA